MTDLRSASRVRRRLAASALALAIVALTALFSGAAPPATAASGSTLGVVSDTELTTFNPFTSYYDGELNIIGVIYPALTVNDKDNIPQPYLASKVEHSADAKTWTFTIRTGLKWSDGKPITVQDIVWTYNLIMKNKAAASANGSIVENFATVTAPNASTIVIKTKSPQANMLYLSIPIVPQHIWQSRVKNIGKELNTETPVVGYGPWILTGFKTDQYATLSRNKDFGTDFVVSQPKFDKLISYYYKSTDAAVSALRSGQVDQLTGMTPAQFKQLGKNKDLAVYQTAPVGWTGIEVNPGARTKAGKKFGTANPALADQRLRSAIAWSINRPQLVTKILDGLGIVGAGYVPASFKQWAWQPTAGQKIGYDPARANKILDQAGYKKDGKGVRIDPKTGKEISLRLGIHSDDDQDQQIAQYVKPWLQAIGLKIKIEPMSFDVLNKNLVKGDWDMLMDGWSTGSDPTYLLSIQTCGALPPDTSTPGYTDAFYCNPKYDALYKKQLATANQSERAKYIGQMQSILYNANIDVTLYYKNQLSGLRKNDVKDYLTGAADAQGVYPLQNHVVNWSLATPIKHKSSSNLGLYIGVPVAVVVIGAAAGLVALRRRSTAAERE
ncbi:MAG: ABC transporter substrate-binding protein [Mycobacteriales bacterium]